METFLLLYYRDKLAHAHYTNDPEEAILIEECKLFEDLRHEVLRVLNDKLVVPPNPCNHTFTVVEGLDIVKISITDAITKADVFDGFLRSLQEVAVYVDARADVEHGEESSCWLTITRDPTYVFKK